MYNENVLNKHDKKIHFEKNSAFMYILLMLYVFSACIHVIMSRDQFVYIKLSQNLHCCFFL